MARFAALGRTRWLYDSVTRCLEQGHELGLVATAPAAPEYGVDVEDFERMAADGGSDFLAGVPINSQEAVERLRSSGAEVALSVNWPTLIGQEARASFPAGVWNAHVGDLPRYRGNACPNWAILNGEPRVVLTVHEMVDDLDAGPILGQESFELHGDTYIGDVYRWLDDAIPDLFTRLLERLESGSLEPRPQEDDPAKSLRTLPRRPEDGAIVWNDSAEVIARLVRASSRPFSGAFTYLDGERVAVWRARAEASPHPIQGVPGQVVELREAGDVGVLCGDGLLVLEEVESSGVGAGVPTRLVRSTRARFADPLTGAIDEIRVQLDQQASGDDPVE